MRTATAPCERPPGVVPLRSAFAAEQNIVQRQVWVQDRGGLDIAVDGLGNCSVMGGAFRRVVPRRNGKKRAFRHGTLADAAVRDSLKKNTGNPLSSKLVRVRERILQVMIGAPPRLLNPAQVHVLIHGENGVQNELLGGAKRRPGFGADVAEQEVTAGRRIRRCRSTQIVSGRVPCGEVTQPRLDKGVDVEVTQDVPQPAPLFAAWRTRLGGVAYPTRQRLSQHLADQPAPTVVAAAALSQRLAISSIAPPAPTRDLLTRSGRPFIAIVP